jgi:hypothetical protein
MKHKSVVRNVACQTGSFNTRERHNKRKNEEYFNGDVQTERSHLNVHFRQCFREDGSPETYHETFNRLLAEKKIVLHGTKPDAKLFCEMVFDINTTYFDERGGYEYAKSFFEEAYHLAVKEAGSEDYIISAVLHADERNKALSEQLGRDVYHYHLHVVYVPVVEKKLYFKKNNKNPELAGKLKEVIPQISQSNKWPLRMTAERDGKMVTLNSYSFLQDRYYGHMKAAGFDGFERGERGSTTEHLEVLEYKIQQDRIQVAELAAKIQEQERAAAENEKRLAAQEKKIKVMQGKALTAKQIENIPVKISRPLLGGAGDDIVTMSKKDWDNVKKTALTQANKDEEYRTALSENATLKNEKSKWRKEKQGLEHKVAELGKSVNQDLLARATKDAELHNLKNAVAKIPQDIWNAYTKSNVQQKNHQQEGR